MDPKVSESIFPPVPAQRMPLRALLFGRRLRYIDLAENIEIRAIRWRGILYIRSLVPIPQRGESMSAGRK